MLLDLVDDFPFMLSPSKHSSEFFSSLRQAGALPFALRAHALDYLRIFGLSFSGK
jgi:hypothetical protein